MTHRNSLQKKTPVIVRQLIGSLMNYERLDVSLASSVSATSVSPRNSTARVISIRHEGTLQMPATVYMTRTAVRAVRAISSSNTRFSQQLNSSSPKRSAW